MSRSAAPRELGAPDASAWAQATDADAARLGVLEAHVFADRRDVLELLGDDGVALARAYPRSTFPGEMLLGLLAGLVYLALPIVGLAFVIDNPLNPERFAAATAIPVGSACFAAAALIQLGTIVVWAVRGRGRSGAAIWSAAIAAVFALLTALLIPGLAAREGFPGWQPLLIPIWAALGLALVSLVLQLAASRPTSGPAGRARRIAELPDADRAMRLDARADAIRTLERRGLLAPELAAAAIDAPLGELASLDRAARTDAEEATR